MSQENFVFKESGGFFHWRNLGVLAVQCVGEAMSALGFARARVVKFSLTEMCAAKVSPPP